MIDPETLSIFLYQVLHEIHTSWSRQKQTRTNGHGILHLPPWDGAYFSTPWLCGLSCPVRHSGAIWPVFLQGDRSKYYVSRGLESASALDLSSLTAGNSAAINATKPEGMVRTHMSQGHSCHRWRSQTLGGSMCKTIQPRLKQQLITDISQHDPRQENCSANPESWIKAICTW